MAKSKSEQKRIESLQEAENVDTEVKNEVSPTTFTYKYTGSVVVNLTKFNLKVRPGDEITLPEEIDNLYFEKVN